MLRDFAKSDAAGGGEACGPCVVTSAARPREEACGLSLGKRCLGKENARGNDAQRGRSLNQGARWPEIDQNRYG